jgi:subtilase family serine protease
MNVLKFVGYLGAAGMVIWAATGSAEALPVRAASIAVPLSPRIAIRDLGRAPANYPVSIVVTLPYRHAAELERLIVAQGDPGSPSYHHFLTPRQFASIFGPTQQDEAVVVQLLRHAGFRTTQLFTNRTVVDAIAPAALAERYFHTDIHLALQADGVHYFNTKPAIVPLELSYRAFTVAGLSNLRTVPPRSPNAPNGMRADKTGIGQPLENEGGYGPLGFAGGYDLPIQHDYTGKGVTVAEVENSEPILRGDIPEFSWAFDVPLPTGLTGASTTLVPVDGGCQSSATCNGASIGGIDRSNYVNYQEYLAALAPGIDTYLYQTPDDTTTSWTDGLNQVVTDNHADIVALGMIFYTEADPNAETFALALDHVIQQGNAIGMTFISPAWALIESTLPAASIPGDSPNVLSVGSSNIQVAASGAFHSEASCLEGFFLPSVSSFFPEPSYVSGISGGYLKDGREQPDLVAAQWIERSTAKTIPLWYYAGGFASYQDGVWNDALVTSSAEPIIALVADIDEMTGSRSGLINSTIYNIYKKEGYGPTAAPLFRNITKSTPGGGSGTSLYKPSKGFNFPTGIGSVDGWNLAQAIGKKK